MLHRSGYGAGVTVGSGLTGETAGAGEPAWAIKLVTYLACEPAGRRAGATASGCRNEPMVRKAGARHRLAQVTLTRIVWYPVAPSGSVRCFSEVWV
jgi:hypothetical protein